jgi:hypothetical protein
MQVKDIDIKYNFTTMIKNKSLDEVKSVKEEWQRFKETENEYGQSDYDFKEISNKI